MSEFGDFISKRRLELNMTLRGFASELGVSAPYLSDIEKGNREPNEKKLLDSLVRVLKLTPEEAAKLYDMAAAQKNELAKDVSEYVTENEMAKVGATALEINTIVKPERIVVMGGSFKMSTMLHQDNNGDWK